MDSILFVDDAPSLLLGLRGMFQRSFEVETAVGGAQGLDAIGRHGPYSVVVSDMRMPGMSGTEFLAKVRQISPDSTRMLLTGHSDMSTAIEAVNQGNIFQYLTKPCEKETLTTAIAAAVQRNRAMRSERELLENTLMGSIKLLTDVLAAGNPEIFGKSMRIVRCVKHIAQRLALPSAWQLEAAASLSQLGCMTFSQELIEQAYVGAKLSPEDQALFDTHPALTRNLLAHLPRLEPIAWMIAQQRERHIPLEAPNFPGTDAAALSLAARILKLAVAFDAYRMRTLTDEEAISRLRSRDAEFAPRLVDLLADMGVQDGKMELRRLPVNRLAAGMILEQEIRSRQGHLKVARGQEVTPALRLKLYYLMRAGVIDGQVLAHVPV